VYIKLGLHTAPLNISFNELLKAFGYQDPWNFHVFFFFALMNPLAYLRYFFIT